MRKICININALYCIYICMWMAYMTNCTSKAFESLSRNPLEGSRETLPGANSINLVPSEARKYMDYANTDLTRLLDVGACTSPSDSNISYVPLLDGASPIETMCQDEYAMKFVLFDLQLIELKSVDPVGGSFRAELQMILHWVDSIKNGANGTEFTDDCSFPCDTNSPRPLCCDNVWVPPLHLPGCDINQIQSSTPTPSVDTHFRENILYYDCFNKDYEGNCIWRRLWYLNIDATCSSQMDFHDFPFDVKILSIDILNPYGSRTWFQLTNGFLQDNIGEDINNLNLSPDKNIPGWYVKELKVSSTCGTSENWKQTFLTQDSLLRALNDSYDTQKDDITNTLNSETLICSNISNSNYVNTDFTSPTDYGLYQVARDNYEERVNSTLATYRQCTQKADKNKNFYWNLSLYSDDASFPNLSKFGYFSTSSGNINRSFSILDLGKYNNMTKVSFECAILAIANLTTPGIRVTILVQRYRVFYVVKIILPTIACVAFSFATFGIHPKDLVGRLTVVVPSAIALTALQGLVVSTDIPPVAYIAPSTYIFLFSYLVQILISFESILVRCLYYQKIPNWLTRRRRTNVPDAPIMNASSNGPYDTVNEGGNTESSETILPIFTNKGSIQLGPIKKERVSTIGLDSMPNEVINECDNRNDEDQNGQMIAIRKFDLLTMFFLGMLYIMAILICTILPWRNSEILKKDLITSTSNSVTLWTQS